MSYQITLNTWSGSSKAEAVEKLAEVFRLSDEKATAIVDHLCQGLPWRFERPIPDSQADGASTYLRSLGFAVDMQSVEGEIKPLSDAVSTAVAPEKDKAETSIPEDSYRFKFQGDGRTLFGISFVNLIKTVFTLGVYRFWAKTNVRQYIWSQTLFSGDRFSYHGTGKELMRGAVWFGVVLILLVLVYVTFNIGMEEGELASDLLGFIILIMLPALMVGAWRYRLSRTAWRNIRFSFRGKRMDAVTLYIVGGILSGLTLGLYWPFFKMKTEKFWRENSWFGDVPFRFSGVGKDFFKKFILAILLTPLTLGFYLFWFTADLKRYLWSHTHVGGATFHFPITGKDYMKLNVANFFIVLFTLGLGFPWVVIRNQKFVTDNMVLAGNIELNHIVQQMKDSGAFGEEAMDIMDVPIDIG
jgi:uncharacterized membrane protein YjgN (DUF898 family)